MGRSAMLVLVEGHPNTAIIIFYVLASAIFALAERRGIGYGCWRTRCAVGPKMDKHAALAQLVKQRRGEEHETFFVLHKFDDGAWDFDHVVPWTKSAQNVDAKLMIIGQDWSSEYFLRHPKHNTPN
jgi:hypothetical protein